MSKLDIFECMHELIENCRQSLSAGKGPPPKWAPTCGFLCRRTWGRSLRTRCTLVSGNPVPQSRDLPRTPCYLRVYGGQSRGTNGRKLVIIKSITEGTRAMTQELHQVMDLMSRANTRMVLPAPAHGGYGNVWDVWLSPYLGLRGLYILHVWRSMPGKGRARTNDVEEQGSSFQKVFRKTFRSVWERDAAEEPRAPG